LPVSTAGAKSRIRYRKQRLRKLKKKRSRKRKSVNVPVGYPLNRLKVQKPELPGFFNAAPTGQDVYLQKSGNEKMFLFSVLFFGMPAS